MLRFFLFGRQYWIMAASVLAIAGLGSTRSRWSRLRWLAPIAFALWVLDALAFFFFVYRHDRSGSFDYFISGFDTGVPVACATLAVLAARRMHSHATATFAVAASVGVLAIPAAVFARMFVHPP